ncbi:pyrroline-5-carboxylate reductase [Acetobacterium bakii]|uniref:Pyrroline-5-carboxylate reductase n=1 Tax=Acetobacterium bakii TaxID=52689 RepID=A0A0L6TVW0_9FIRM|nr:pyrroline-5-carboxylate reductase [Acetobacterium bakii]KNZ40383.1 pyrroline-5-carboxylate reductase [Acetobacterium bakii]
MKNIIGFIGCGNMASAMIGGLIKSDLFPAENILVYDPMEGPRGMLAQKYGITVLSSNKEVANKADYLVLAVKPFLYAKVLKEIAQSIQSSVIIISIAVGVSFNDIKGLVGENVKVIRTQPSTPAFVGESDSTICPDDRMNQEDILDIVAIFESFGKVEIISEKLMEVVPGIASSAPAYTMLLIEAMADGGVLHGFPRDQAYRLSAQAVLGAAKLVLESGEHPGKLKDQICTPGGTTIEAVRVLEAKGFRDAVISAVDACAKKSISMGKK